MFFVMKREILKIDGHASLKIAWYPSQYTNVQVDIENIGIEDENQATP